MKTARSFAAHSAIFVASLSFWAGAAAAQGKFSSQAWLQAVDPKNPTWSREGLMKQFFREYKIDGMERTKVILLLGNPANASELDPGSRYRSRIDSYCLSAKDRQSLRIDYDEKDKVKSYLLEASPCKSCHLFIGAAPAANRFLKIDTLKKSFLGRYTEEQIRNIAVKRVEAIIGPADKSWTVKSEAGRQLWVNFNYVWRLSADGSRVFLVSGRHRPVRDWKPGEDPGVESWAIVSMGTECRTSDGEEMSDSKK